MTVFLPFVTGGLALLALVLATVAWLQAGKARKQAAQVERSLKDTKGSGDDYVERHREIERDRVAVRRLGIEVEELRDIILQQARRSDAIFATSVSPLRSGQPSSLMFGAHRAIAEPARDIVQPSVPLPPPHAPLRPPQDPFASQIDRLRLDFNDMAQQPSPEKLDAFVSKHGFNKEPEDFWRMLISDGRVAILPGRAMLVGWARQYRGEMGKALRDDQLAQWYEMTADEVLALDRIAIQRPSGVIEKGVLRGI
jgi:hypothetical protein